MELEKFRDQAVQRSLFKFVSPDDVPMSLLRHWAENAYYNEKMARMIILLDGIIAHYPDSLRNGLVGFTDRLPILLAGVDDHRATMAVEALGKSTFVGQQMQEEKKKGLFGMFSGKKKE